MIELCVQSALRLVVQPLLLEDGVIGRRGINGSSALGILATTSSARLGGAVVFLALSVTIRVLESAVFLLCVQIGRAAFFLALVVVLTPQPASRTSSGSMAGPGVQIGSSSHPVAGSAHPASLATA